MSEALLAAFQAAGFHMIETHISRVFIHEQEVYKIKRPVNLGFLDFTTLAQREQACEAELQLNGRLAQGVYIDVSAIVDARAGKLTIKPKAELAEEPVLEWAVHMRRLHDEDRADVRLMRGELKRTDVEQMALLLARFHHEARADERTASFGIPAIIAKNVEENFEQVASTIDEYLDPSESAQLMVFQRNFMRLHAGLLTERARDGFVRDGHGDLRLEHFYKTPEDSYLAIDCIEFNERFRYADVCADLAFLVMDFAYHERADLADLLIASYARESTDYGIYALLDFYQSYRAVVRAKVSSMLAHDANVAHHTRERAQHEARRYYLLAMSVSRPQLTPTRIIVTFGLMASGKSTLSRALSERLGVAVLSADRTRKELLQVQPTEALHEQAFTGAYDAETTDKVYATLFARAEQILRSGRSVILDATFRARSHREQARDLSRRCEVDIVFIECRCSKEVTLQRLHKRAQGPSVSDGRIEILDAVSAQYEPSSELPSTKHTVLDTGVEKERALHAALLFLGEPAQAPSPQLELVETRRVDCAELP